MQLTFFAKWRLHQTHSQSPLIQVQYSADITHLQHSAPPLIWSKSNSPPPQDICTHEHSPPVPPNPPESPNTGLNYASDQDNTFHQPDQPDADMDYPDELLSPNHDKPHLPNEPPSFLKPSSPPSPHPDPLQPLLMYLGCDKDQWRWRSKCMSYVALRGAILEQ